MAIIIIIVFVEIAIGVIIGEAVWRYSKLKNEDK
jgi:uncharacterized membrane protein AbrB (regulator of aidB expression)